MAIYSPDIRLNENDRRLITALSKHLISSLEKDENKSSFSETVLISHEDALKLLKILKSKSEDSMFIKKIYFCEHIFLRNTNSEDICKSIFKEGRRQNGKSNVLSSAKWAELIARLGIRSSGIYKTAGPMKFDYFFKMETKLFKSLGLHPAVINLLLKLLKEEREFISGVRTGKITVKPNSLLKPISDIIEELQDDIASRKNSISLPTRKLAAATFLIADTTVIFTTRDWSTTGTLSAVSSNAVLLSL